MKALTLWQPWASMVALGYKTIETRSWATDHRGPLAIHAAKVMPHEAELACYENETIYNILQRNGLTVCNLPRGFVIAIVRLHTIQKTEDALALGLVNDVNLALGDFAPGRYAWTLNNITAVEPVRSIGGQRIWNFVEPGD
ncbi:MAG: ASCH domain-containing protein [Planctomycetaceae bacterium]